VKAVKKLDKSQARGSRGGGNSNISIAFLKELVIIHQKGVIKGIDKTVKNR
jgi:hypothetical protein